MVVRLVLAVVLLLPVGASANEVVLADGVGDGFASFGVDEFGSIRGCGRHGVVFDPAGPMTSGQASCHSALYLFDSAGGWRQALANGEWSYHPIYNASSHLRCIGGDRPTDVLASTAYVTSDALVAPNRRVTEFIVPSYPNLTAHLEQTVCGSHLYQAYEFTVVSGPPVNLIATRYSDADLGFPSAGSWRYNAGAGLSATAVEMSAAAGAVRMSVEMMGDAAVDGWRLWQCGSGGASDFARFMFQDGWTPAQLNQERRCTGGPWCARSATTSGGTATVGLNDTGIGVQGRVTVAYGAPREIAFLTSMAPGQPASLTISSAIATPDVLWPPDGTLRLVNLDVQAEGCGVSCVIESVTSNQAIEGPGDPDPDYVLGAGLSLDLNAERTGGTEREYWVGVLCGDVLGNVSTATVTVTVPGGGNPNPGGGNPNPGGGNPNPGGGNPNPGGGNPGGGNPGGGNPGGGGP